MIISYLFLVIASLANAGANIAMKFAGIQAPDGGLKLYFSGYFFAALFMFGINLIFYSQALRAMPMFIAYPILVGLSILFVMALSVLCLSEAPTFLQLIGMLIIMLGIYLTIK